MNALLDRLLKTPTGARMLDEASQGAASGRAQILARRAGAASAFAKTLPPLEAAYATAVEAIGPVMQTARAVEGAAQRARAELRSATVSFEQVDVGLVRELRATADPGILAAAAELLALRERVLLGQAAVAAGAHRGKVGVRLTELWRYVGEELTVLPTPEALESLAEVRAEVAALAW